MISEKEQVPSSPSDRFLHNGEKTSADERKVYPDLQSRSLWGAGGAIIFLGAILAPAPFPLIFFCFLTFLAFVEFSSLIYAFSRHSFAIRPLGAALLAGMGGGVLALWEHQIGTVSMILLTGITLWLTIRSEHPFPGYVFLIVSGFVSALVLRHSYGRFELLIPVFCTWAADIGAYFFGIRWGTRPFSPALSPKKTWEGYWGGVVIALGAGLILGLSRGRLLFGILSGAVAGLAGPFGDIAESRLKRLSGRKDSGLFLPGHGGCLDRFDAFFVNTALLLGLARLIGI
ncbi:MAG: hypothetical protein D6679_12000 [Candidatus Hydrogenedentota bacterium]|nr:MAG: hypothetical protein D6679_12000 [Candidatus Hydrogenedentota bacterium]